MDNDIAIKVENVSKVFRLPHEKQSSVKGALISIVRGGKRTYEKQEVLKDISFEIKKGEFFGIVGRNGSGKSTLLKMLAGIYSPTEGAIHINGKLTPFIELGVGFNPELTGRENVFLNGALLGFNRKEMSAMYNDIVAFAEIKKFMDQKLKNYSSGMQVRLAFSIAIRAKSDILLLDEVLAVGDAAFQRKCYNYFMELKENKQTVVLVTHDMSAVRQFCDKAVMIESGKIVKQGNPDSVAQAYQKLFNHKVETALLKEKTDGDSKKTADRWGEGGLMAEKPLIKVSNDKITLTTFYEASTDIPPPIYGFTVYGPKGDNIMEGNTRRVKLKTQSMMPGDRAEVIWEIPNIFAQGSYKVSVACCDQSATLFYDWLNKAITFKVYKEGVTAGIVDPRLNNIKYKVSNKQAKNI